MSGLAARIAALIAAQGPITVAQYMTFALHDPRDGYYATRDPLVADFITAPEISQMFGELIGLWLAQCWLDQGQPKRPLLVELGPGRGTLMCDALRALNLVPALREQIEVVLVEASPVLREMQRTALADTNVPMRWAHSLGEIPADRPLLLVANEFFDALPIRQFVKTERGWCERMITADSDGRLAFAVAPEPYPAAQIPASRDSAPDGGFYEISTAGDALAEDIGRWIAAHGGAALIVDYGYAGPGFGETLQAMRAHRFAEVLGDPGANDLTAHVDFEALAAAARRGGAQAPGPVGQDEFLVALGILHRMQTLLSRDSGPARSRNYLETAALLRSQVDRLILPEQMGTLFKALAIVPSGAKTPSGF
ncbi:MAG: SAM-dependent methyltransferase [Proteobacteria bacterium]|nr:SAM-dependent methyltransferase [Pseudomonadota bacterium]